MLAAFMRGRRWRMELYEEKDCEHIKCVVVGDTGVGKTRLICAQTCGQRPTLEQLINPHVPTVWAIDQYRTCKKILERSYQTVDDVRVSLRLWDTFGDHHTDRRFSYGRSDVVLLCFSVASTRSLRHVKTVWYPEIKRMCPPHTPIVLVGCKNDLRYMVFDARLQTLMRERRPLLQRCVTPSDIVPPELGRHTAKDIGASYYEASVFTYFGVHEVFENVIRAALCQRRAARLWLNSLSAVRHPLVQLPHLPPRPATPVVVKRLSSTYDDDVHSILSSEAHCDIKLEVEDVSTEIHCHKLMLAACSPIFYRILVCDTGNCANCSFAVHEPERQSSLDACDSIESANDVSDTSFHKLSDKAHLLGDLVHKNLEHWHSSTNALTLSLCPSRFTTASKRHRKSRSPSTSASGYSLSAMHEDIITNHRAAVQHVRTSPVAATSLPGCIAQVVYPTNGRDVTSITFHKTISPETLRLFVSCLYSTKLWSACANDHSVATNIHKLADTFKVIELNNLLNDTHEDPARAIEAFRQRRSANLLHWGVDLNLFGGFPTTIVDQPTIDAATSYFTCLDVDFCLDNGVVRCHKAFLIVRCDMMKVMFRGQFLESSSSTVSMPGVTVELFHSFLHYIYADQLSLSPSSVHHHAYYLDLLELANRFFLSHLTYKLEVAFINDLNQITNGTANDHFCEDILQLLESARLCNAHRLVDWCLHYTSVHYNKVCKLCPKQMKTLSTEDQEYFAKHRWPPIWYLKEFDYYERHAREEAKIEHQRLLKYVSLKRVRSSSGNGCICFNNRVSKYLQHSNSL